MKFAVLFLGLLWNLGLIVQADVTSDLVQVVKGLGTGECNRTIFLQKNSKTATCYQVNVNNIQTLCSEITNSMECFDEIFSECWTPEGITKYKTVVLRYLLQTTPSENTEEFENCSAFKEIFANSKVNEAVVANSINGGKSGLDEAREFNEEEGNGECSPERYSEIQQLQGICAQSALAQLRPTRNVLSLCPIVDEALKCIKSFSECYSPEKMIRYKKINFKILLETLQEIGNSKLLEKCPYQH